MAFSQQSCTFFVLFHARPLSRFSCVWLCDLMGRSLPGSSVHGILRARILEWVSVPFLRGSAYNRGWTCVSCVCLHWQAGSLPVLPSACVFTPHSMLPCFPSARLPQLGGPSRKNKNGHVSMVSSSSLLRVLWYRPVTLSVPVTWLCLYYSYSYEFWKLSDKLGHHIHFERELYPPPSLMQHTFSFI